MLVNQVSEDIGCFYELVVEVICRKNNIKLLKSIDYSNSSGDLFQEKKVLVCHSTNTKQIESLSKNNIQKIIISD